MRNQCVTADQARDLRGLGFSEKCPGFYTADDNWIQTTHPDGLCATDLPEDCNPSPLRQQALAFYREQFNLHAGVFLVEHLQQYEFYITIKRHIDIDDILGKVESTSTVYSSWAYDTYTEAESAMISRLWWAAKYVE